MFFYPSFGVCHPDSAQILYKSSAPKAHAVGGAYRYLRDWIGKNAVKGTYTFLRDWKGWILLSIGLTFVYEF